MITTLVITNDFPPRIGGIESFVVQLCDILATAPDSRVVVLTSQAAGSGNVDRSVGYRVVRRPGPLLPTRSTTRAAQQLIMETGATRVVFGAAAPLSLMAPHLRSSGVERQLAISHGHETWWATLPLARSLLRRMADGVDHLSTISDYTQQRIAPALSRTAQEKMIKLSPPVDPSLFHPGPDSRSQRPRCLAAGRFVAQKGFRTLVEAWPLVLQHHSWPVTPELVLIGDGPDRRRLERRVSELAIGASVSFVGAVPPARMPQLLQSAEVFALPVRTRLGGLNPEGLGLVFLEAAACGLPIIVGDSGGARETVEHGKTGFLIDSDDQHQLAARLSLLLGDPDRGRAMGLAGRARVLREFGMDRTRDTLLAALDLAPRD